MSKLTKAPCQYDTNDSVAAARLCFATTSIASFNKRVASVLILLAEFFAN